MAEKNYRAATGVTEYYYGIINDGITADKVYRVEYLQEISVEIKGEIDKAHGDNKETELAYSQTDTSVTSKLHKLPMEDKNRLFGFEEQEGIVAKGSSDNPP